MDGLFHFCPLGATICGEGGAEEPAILRIRLTKSAIDGVPVSPKDTVYWDVGLPGFGVKVTPKGRKVFMVLYRVAGAGSRLRKYTIGPYGRITLPMARAQAQKIFAARLDGRDPAEEKKQSRRRLVVDRIDDLVETFIQERVSQTRTVRRITNLLRRDVIAHWGAKSIHEIKKRDVSDLVTEISHRNAHAAYRLLKTLKTFFRWCVGRAIIDFSPAEGVQSNFRDISRDRVLTDQELAAVIVKDASYSEDDYDGDPAQEVDIAALAEYKLKATPLAGFVLEGLSPYGRPASTSRTRAIMRAAYTGFPVVLVGRGNTEGFATGYGPFIGGSNLTATKARFLLMLCIMKFGMLPPARDPANPTREETETVARRVKDYQAIFDTH